MTVGEKRTAVGGLAGWLLGRLRRGGRIAPRLALVERISLAPRQSLALVEAEGRRFLVATSSDGAPTFFALDERVSDERVPVERVLHERRNRPSDAARQPVRVSW